MNKNSDLRNTAYDGSSGVTVTALPVAPWTVTRTPEVKTTGVVTVQDPLQQTTILMEPPGGVKQVAADNGGLRYSEGKPRYDLIPPEAIEAIAVHYMQGAKKYADRNWERGMDWGQCYRALMSHAIKWHKGETYDSDPSMPGYDAHHMIAVAWNAIALYIYQTRGIGRDDRNIVKKD